MPHPVPTWPEDGLCEIEGCPNAAVVGLQGQYLCMPHYEQAMKALSQFLRRLTGEPDHAG